MAYSFTGTGRLYSAVPVGSVPPLTLSARVLLPSAPPGDSVICSLCYSGDGGSTRYVVGVNSSSNVYALTVNAVPGPRSVDTDPAPHNAWHSVLGVFASSSSRIVAINGSKKTENTDSVSPNASLLNLIYIGRRSTAYEYLTGQVAEVALWSAALTDDELVSLAKGFKPSRIRPQNLVWYSPAVRNLIDLKRGLTITNENATVTDHPRVY